MAALEAAELFDAFGFAAGTPGSRTAARPERIAGPRGAAAPRAAVDTAVAADARLAAAPLAVPAVALPTTTTTTAADAAAAAALRAWLRAQRADAEATTLADDEEWAPRHRRRRRRRRGGAEDARLVEIVRYRAQRKRTLAAVDDVLGAVARAPPPPRTWAGVAAPSAVLVLPRRGMGLARCGDETREGAEAGEARVKVALVFSTEFYNHIVLHNRLACTTNINPQKTPTRRLATIGRREGGVPNNVVRLVVPLSIPSECLPGVWAGAAVTRGVLGRRAAAGAREGRNLARSPEYRSTCASRIRGRHRARSWGPVSGKGDYRSRLGSRERVVALPLRRTRASRSAGAKGRGGGRAARRPGDSSHGSRRTSSHGEWELPAVEESLGGSRHASFGFR